MYFTLDIQPCSRCAGGMVVVGSNSVECAKSFIVGGKTRTTADADLWKQHNENTNLNESFIAGISDTMYALDFEENGIR